MKTRFLPFNKAREIVRGKHFRNLGEFYAWRKPNGITSAPHRTYKDQGWVGYRDFLGTKPFLSFVEARKAVRAKHFKTALDFKTGNRPKNVPSNPDLTYKDSGWISWGDFLGTHTTRRQSSFLPFADARAIVRSKHLKSESEFKLLKRPDGIPSTPRRVYRTKGWKDWGDFLGTGNVSNSKKKFLPFEQARTIVRAQRFKNEREFKAWKKPVGIPSNPNIHYRDKGWAGGRDWLGKR
jgi:hypothetical protein